jgi:hypothetical protein
MELGQTQKKFVFVGTSLAVKWAYFAAIDIFA